MQCQRARTPGRNKDVEGEMAPVNDKNADAVPEGVRFVSLPSGAAVFRDMWQPA